MLCRDFSYGEVDALREKAEQLGLSGADPMLKLAMSQRDTVPEEGESAGLKTISESRNMALISEVGRRSSCSGDLDVLRWEQRSHHSLRRVRHTVGTTPQSCKLLRILRPACRASTARSTNTGWVTAGSPVSALPTARSSCAFGRSGQFRSVREGAGIQQPDAGGARTRRYGIFR